MNCTNCSQPLPGGVGFCPNCGVPTPYNTGGAASSPYTATVASPYGNPQSAPSIPPTMAAGPYDYSAPEQNPYTNYGAGQQVPANQNYNMPPPPPVNQAASYYNASSMPGYAPVPGMQPGIYNPAAMPPKKKSKVGLIIGLSLLGVVVLCGGLFAAAAQLGKSASTTTATTTTRSTYNTPVATTVTNSVPTSADLIPSAQKILFSAQTSKAINKDYLPTQPSTTFTVGKDVDLTFQVDSAGQDGYIKVKWYGDGQEVSSEILQHHAENNQGYFPYSYVSAGSGAAALFWCTEANCSDEQAARVTYFTVTD